IRDLGLPTQVVSVDPAPCADIDALCDQVIRQRLEEIDGASLAANLGPGDVLFFDGSHRCLQNSDVTVFLLEVLPALQPGVLIGLHDVFLPYDYPESWCGRFYSEQLALGCWLLGDGWRRVRVELPVWWLASS